MTAEPTTTSRPKKILRGIRDWGIIWGQLWLLTMIPPMSDWLKNRDQVTIHDMILPAVTGLVLGFLVTAVVFTIYRKNRFAAMIGGVAAILFLSQGYNSLLLKMIVKVYAHGGDRLALLCAVVGTAIGITLIWLLHRFTRRWTTKTDILTKGINIAIIAAFVINAFTFVRVVVSEWPQFFYRPAEITAPMTIRADNKPDIYYIVLDRYASQSVLETQFNFDNADFITYLAGNNFYVKPDAYSNYPFTTMSISSTLTMGYHTDSINRFGANTYQTVQPFHNDIHYSSVIRKLKSLGYRYYHLGTWYEATSPAPLADYYYQPEGQLTLFNHRFTLSDFAKRKYYSSVFRYIFRHALTIKNFTIWRYSSQSNTDATLAKFDQLEKIADAPSGGRFVFAHILSPHYPYYFNADGSYSKDPGYGSKTKPVKEKYTGQMEFINSRIKTVLESIMQNSDGQAIVVIQADEGEYPMYIYPERFGKGFNVNALLGTGDMTAWPEDELKLKYGILAAYHVPNAPQNVLEKNANSVNIFRIIFNAYFGADLPYLPDCHYAYPHGRSNPFDFAKINQQLTGEDDPACSDNGS